MTEASRQVDVICDALCILENDEEATPEGRLYLLDLIQKYLKSSIRAMVDRILLERKISE